MKEVFKMTITLKANGYNFEKFNLAIGKFDKLAESIFPEAKSIQHFNYAESIVMTDLIINDKEYCCFNLSKSGKISMAGSHTLSRENLAKCQNIQIAI